MSRLGRKALLMAALAGSLIGMPNSASAFCVGSMGCSDTNRFSRSDLLELSCQGLWEVRNWIYKENGYCFQTARARNYFGNDGCWTSSQGEARSNMNGHERGNVDAIVSLERETGCR